MKKHKLDAKRNTTLVRKGIQKWMNATGVGPGALITSRRSFYSNNMGYVPSKEADQQPRVFLVTEASLTSVMHTDGLPGTRQSHQFIRATDVASGSQVFFGLPHIPTVAPASGFEVKRGSVGLWGVLHPLRSLLKRVRSAPHWSRVSSRGLVLNIRTKPLTLIQSRQNRQRQSANTSVILSSCRPNGPILLLITSDNFEAEPCNINYLV
jgi:hypothetical protein